MSPTYEYDVEANCVTLFVASVPDREAEGKMLAQLAKDISGLYDLDFIISIKTVEGTPTKADKSFGELLLIELRNYIARLAVVCDPGNTTSAYALAQFVSNQNKPTKIFHSIDDARAWLS
jgi:hypothetical protein